MKKYFFITLFLCGSFFGYSQQGKDGAGNITSANTVVNIYTKLYSWVGPGQPNLTVGSTAGFSPGDLIFIIQMQGAIVNAGKDSIFPDFTSAIPTNTTYGAITNYNFCGNREFAQVKAVTSSSTMVIDCGAYNWYNPSGSVQVIRVPRYTTLTVSGAGSITAPSWDGITGGVAVVEVQFNAVLNGAASIDVSGKGFRGGIAATAVLSSTVSSNKYGSLKMAEGGMKGESIGGDTARYRVLSSIYGKGAIANGGGGGCAQNSGGGGGANGGVVSAYNGLGNPAAGYNTIWNLEFAGMATNTSSGGGRGGYTFSGLNANVNTTPPGSGSWGGDTRRVMGGIGGRPLDYSWGAVFMGGGGGAAHGNNIMSTSGGNGGGIAYVLCYGNLSGTGAILADGASAASTPVGCTGNNDGAGGGGGGGSIVLDVAGTISMSAATALSAKGGNGGNVNHGGGCLNGNVYGPGAGGGGGYILSAGTVPANNISGGNNGTVVGSSTSIGLNFPPNGATKGGAGSIGPSTLATVYTITPVNATICINSSATVSATSSNTTSTLTWYDQNVAGNVIGTGSTLTTSVITTAGTYTVYAGMCPGSFRVPVLITATNGPVLTVNTPTICSGTSTVLTAGGATSYTWSTGPTTSSISVSPTVTTVYTVTGSSGGSCAANKTATVVVNSIPSVSVTPQSICTGSSATLTASGATSYSWSTGAATASVAVSPTTTTSYTVTGSNGTCSSNQTTTVTVNTLPTVSASTAAICSGQTGTLTASGASTYTWNPGNISGTSVTVSPASSQNYTVTGTNATGCVNSATTAVNVTATPTLATNAASICTGGVATLTVSGAGTYTWLPGGATGSTFTVSPGATTTYSVTGASGSCSSTKTTAVTVNSLPAISSSTAAICSGQTATLSASGANTYTWNPGNLSGSSVTVSPSSNQTYSVSGTSTAGCVSTSTTQVGVTASPTVAASSTSICPGNTGTVSASGATTYTWNPGGVTGITFTASPASNTVYTVMGANGSCTSAATASINVGPGVSLTVNTPTICAGQTATLTVSGASTYTWSTGSNATSITVNPGATTSYTVNGSAAGCNGSKTTTVTVNSLPSVSSSSVAICSGQTATLTASGANTYTWNPGNLGGNSVTVSPSSTQTYSVSGTDAAGCTNTSTTSVGVTTTPTVSASSASICPGGTATLTASGASSYTWNPGNISGASYTASPGANSTYTVMGTNGSCTGIATASVNVGSSISLTASNATICAGQTATLMVSGATSYTWSTGAFTSSTAVSPAANTTYSVTGSTGSCSGSQTVSVMVNSLPAIFSPTTSICSGQTATLTASGAATYTWLPGNLSGNTVTVSPVSTTNFTIMGTDALNCTNTSTTDVGVTNTPTVSVSSVTVCTGQTATLTASGAGSYTWSPGGVTGSSFTVAPASNSTYTVSGANGNCVSSAITASVDVASAISVAVNSATICAGQSVTLTATSPASSYTWSTGGTGNTAVVSPTVNTVYTATASTGACTGSGSGSVTVNSVPTLTIDGSSICAGQTVTLTASGATSYTWNPTSANTSTLIDSPSSSTTYTLLGDVSGCVGMAMYNVTVTPNPTLSVNSATICSGSATLTASGATSYLWMPGGLSGASVVVSPTVSTTYTVTGNDLGCASTITTTVTLTSAPALLIGSDINAGCNGACVNFSSTVTGYSALIFDFGDGTVQTPSVSAHCYPSPGTYSVYASGSYSNGCLANSANILTITVNAAPAPSFTTSGAPFYPGTNVSFVNTTAGVNSYSWLFGDGMSSGSVLVNPSHAYSNTGNYCVKLVATDSLTGCKDSVTNCIDIEIPVTLNIPNVFSPNGDDVNEVFRASGTGIREFSCTIYDRWGLQMYDWSGLGGGWDGKTKAGVAVPTGTYFYIINYTDVTDKKETVKGYLMLYKN